MSRLSICNLFFEIEFVIMFRKPYSFLNYLLLFLIIRRSSSLFSGFGARIQLFSMQAVKCTGSKEGRQCGGFTTNTSAANSFIYTFRSNSTNLYLYNYSPIPEILPPRCFVNTFTSP